MFYEVKKKYVCCVCGEEYTKGYMKGKLDFYCKHCFFEMLEDEMGVREVC